MKALLLAAILISVVIISGCSQKEAEPPAIQKTQKAAQDVYYRQFSDSIEIVKSGEAAAEIRYDSSEGILKSVERLQNKIQDMIAGTKGDGIPIYDDISVDLQSRLSLKTGKNIISISSSATNILLESSGKISPITDLAPDKKEIKILPNPESPGRYIVVLRAYRVEDAGTVIDEFISGLTN